MRTVTACAVLVLLGAASPVAAQHGGAAASLSGPVEVPLHVHGGRLWVPVQAPGGAELAFIVSTGNSVTILSESAARRLGADAHLTLPGGIPVPMEGSQTTGDASITTEGKRFDGILGINSLNPYEILVDAPGGRLVLRPIGGPHEWEGMRLAPPVRLRVYHGVVIALDVELNGRMYPAMLDLGSPRLLVNQRVITEAGVADSGAGTLRLGTTAYADVPVQLSDHPVIERFSPNGDGFVVVGAPIATRCAVSISFTRRELRTCVR